MSDLQKFQDMLAAMQAQRDQALNAHVMLQAELASVRRTIAERDARIKELEAEISSMKPTEVVA
jgi:predicted  nucleic acid-binding Zn-ribbon protein